jgi:hypothetical protein
MDNYFKNCPAKGSDGRHFTDYQSPTRRNEYIKYINGNITRDDEYRLFLQQNGAEIMKKTFAQYKEKSFCPPLQACVHTYPTRVSAQNLVEEMARYNAKAMGTLTNSPCRKYEDYTQTSY